VRQPSDDRALYYRQLRDTVRNVFAPELTSPQASDAVGLVDRILAEFVVEEEAAPALSAEFGAEFAALLQTTDDRAGITPARFDELRADAAGVVVRDAGSADPGVRERARQLADVERRFLERLDELRRVVLADEPDRGSAPTADECSVTPAQITAYLAHRLPGSPGVAVQSVSVVPGGRSKETILVTLTGTTELPPTVILRKDRPVGVLATRAADEFAVIRAVHDYGGVPVPEPYFAEEEGHELGDGTFLIMECVAGHKAGEHFPDLAAPVEHREEIGLQLAAALARLHSLPLDRLAGTKLGAPQPAPSAESIAATVGAIGARIDELTGPPCATVGLAREWLVEHAADVVPAPRLSLLQGDFGFHNMLVDGARVTALVDWEGASVGPPARELAAAYNAATALMPWPAFVDAYVRAGGSPDDADPRAIGYYRVLTAFGAFMANRTGGHLFRTGAKRDLLTAHSGLDARIRCERNLARALHDAM
jgi:aminoglycoside phosphotransferase (APT) family kinase protein